MESSEADSDEDEAEASSSTSSEALISGVSCNSQPAVVPTTTRKGSEKLEAQELPSSSSNSSPAPCSPSQERGEREEAGSDQPAEQEGTQHSNNGQDTEKTILTETENPGVSHCFPADGAVTQPSQPAVRFLYTSPVV